MTDSQARLIMEHLNTISVQLAELMQLLERKLKDPE